MVPKTYQQMFDEKKIRVDGTTAFLNVDRSIIERLGTRLNRLSGNVFKDFRFHDAKDLGQNLQDTAHRRKP